MRKIVCNIFFNFSQLFVESKIRSSFRTAQVTQVHTRITKESNVSWVKLCSNNSWLLDKHHCTIAFVSFSLSLQIAVYKHSNWLPRLNPCPSWCFPLSCQPLRSCTWFTSRPSHLRKNPRLLWSLTGLRSRGIHQSAAIKYHPDCRGAVNRILNVSVPDPFFPTPPQKKKSSLAMRDYGKKRSGYARLC